MGPFVFLAAASVWVVLGSLAVWLGCRKARPASPKKGDP